ncbi:protein JINGUBANG [Physcomitrium patens]|uniref:Uncharacterized protein n=1 Tax=Physcomitrium patens TaxID=3218 RepID=A0A2K1L6L6_PHYPA|nr:protein JINGUBANG-like [Physcomitrium patens]PNR61654.1 hypothetical protein PHYPA_000077 [Physcomitrium patens]|eukprot:XP_024394921.1 protein JINGUBANG-like [Physcomitrella patens]
MGVRLMGQDSLDSEASTSSSLVSSRSCTNGRGPHKCIAILHGQALHVITLALSGDVLYAGSNHGDIRAWDHPDMQEATKFGSGRAAVKCIVVVGNRVISAHQDHKIRVWRRSKCQPQEYRLVSTLPSIKDYIANFLPAKNYVQVRRHHKSLWINHNDSISCLAVGNGVLYSGSWDKSVKVWRLSDFKCLESLCGHIDAVNALAVDKQHDLLYTGSGDTTVKVYQRQDLGNKKSQHVLVATLEVKSPVNALALSPEGALLYTAQSDKTVTIWKMKEIDGDRQWTAVGTLRGHRLAILCLTIMSNLVITGSADTTVRVWRRDAEDVHTCLSVMVGHTGPVKSLCVLSDMAMGALVYSGSMDGDIRVWWLPEDETDLLSSDDSSPDSPVVINWRSSSISTGSPLCRSV